MAHSPGNADQSDSGSRLRRSLYPAVAVLGAAVYGVSFSADGGDIGWPVRFAALAALVVVLGLLSPQKPHPLLIAVLAAMGFLDGLAGVVTGPTTGALTTIGVLGGLQAVVAIAALTLAPRAAEVRATSGYESYLDSYNQAVQQYYRQQHAAAAPDTAPRSGYGQAYGEAYGQARYPAQAPYATPAPGRPVQPFPQYGDYTELLSPQQDHRHNAVSAPTEPGAVVPPPGRAGAGPAQPTTHIPGSTDESARPG